MDNEMLEKREYDDDIVEIDLLELGRDILKMFKKFWWLCGLIIGVCVGGYLLFTYVRYVPMYECKATFTVVTDGDSGSYNFYYSQSTADQLSKTFPYVLESNYFKSALKAELGKDNLNGTVTASAIERSNMVTMQVRSTDPTDAAEILQAALDIYPVTARFVLGNIQFHMIDQPQVSSTPYNRPSFKRVVGLGSLGGCALSLAFLGLLAFTRRTVKVPEDMEKITSLKCLAAIPQVKLKARKKKKEMPLSVLEKRAPYGFRESYNAQVRRIEAAMKAEDSKVLLITSTEDHEGKTTLAANVAMLLAAQGKRVLLLDADLYTQGASALLGVTDGPSFREMISQENGLLSGVKRLDKNGLMFIGCGRAADKTTGVLSHAMFKKSIEALKKQLDYVIIDSPACSMYQDAAILAEYADSILYTVKYDAISRQKLMSALSFFQDQKAGFLGYVFNNCPQNGGQYGYGYGRYGYGNYGYSRYGNRKYGYSHYGDNGYGEENKKE